MANTLRGVPDQARTKTSDLNHEPDQVPVPDQARTKTSDLNHEPDQVPVPDQARTKNERFKSRA